MKNKILLSTLLGSALLAGCTADDALDVKNDVAKGVNPAAPVFTISFGDDDMTRATLGSNGLIWQVTDEMSLYHGGGQVVDGVATATKNEDSNFLESGQVRMFDAIYSGTENGEDFTTQAMVTEGLAIMIYPADTAYAQTDKNPHIFLTNEQDEKTKFQMPYVSEMLQIGEYNGKDYEHTAGYGRKYDVRMRLVASLLQLTLNGQNNTKLTDAGIEAPDFKKVKIEVDPASGNKALPFTTEMWVKVGKERRNEGKNGGDDEVGTNTKEHEYWKYSPWIEPVDASEKIGKLDPRTNWISTTDIENNKEAYFTILPYEDRPDVDVVIEEKEDKSLEAKYGKVTITVETNYGEVTMVSEGKEDEEKLWSNGAGTKTYNIKDGLTYVLKSMMDPAPATNKLYAGQYVGAKMNHKLTVDLSDLNMNNLHISNQADLNKALDVYKALEKTDAARFILDGDKDGSKKFYMDYATWKRVAELMADENNKITFAACNDEKPCTTIVLTSNDPENTNVPALVFDNKDWFIDNKIQGTLTVELAEGTTWTFDATQEEAKTMACVKTLVVAKGATLNLTNTTINVNNNLSTSNPFELVNDGKVNINGDVYLMNKMTNHGTILIPATGENRFLMYTGGELTNSEDAVYDRDFEEGWWTLEPETASVLRNAGGVIDNHKTLAIVTNSGGKIYNYGTINIWNTTARTLITTNQDTGADIKVAYSKTNRFGTINLQDNGAGVDNLTIQTANTNGFIKYATSKGATASSTMANYVVVDTKMTVPATNGTSIEYIEIQYKDEELKIAGKVEPTALIIPKGRSIFLPNTTAASLKAEYIYLKGSITHAKDITTGYVFVGYFGGDAKDKNNLFSAY